MENSDLQSSVIQKAQKSKLRFPDDLEFISQMKLKILYTSFESRNLIGFEIPINEDFLLHRFSLALLSPEHLNSNSISPELTRHYNKSLKAPIRSTKLIKMTCWDKKNKLNNKIIRLTKYLRIIY